MSTEYNQENKKRVWDFWQELNNAKGNNIINVLRAYLPEDISWTGPQTNARSANLPIYLGMNLPLQIKLERMDFD